MDFIKRTLAEANILPDEGPDIGGDCGPYVQSERQEIYQKYAEELVEKGFAYRCFCDPEEGRTDKSFSGYDRRCRDLDPAEAKKHLDAGDSYVIRQKMPLSGSTTFHDVVHGAITIDNSELEDQVLIKRDGMPTYNFANVVDDHLMRITHIIRGTEFITSTPKHVLLYQAFSWEIPVYVHLSPVMGRNEDGSTSKLSKRHGATSFSELIAMGYLPEAITNYVALLGWSPKSNRELFSMEELIEAFSLEGLSKSPAVFDYAKLDWFNGEYFPDFVIPFKKTKEGAIAAPMNAARHKYLTPCAIRQDRCYDCQSPDRICSAQVIYWKKMNHMDMEVVLIDEAFGF